MKRKVGASFLGLMVVGALTAGVITRDEALAAAYPGADIQARRIYLSEEQRLRVQELSGEALDTRLIASYIARKDGREVGRAYVDTHLVRSKKESLLVCLDTSGRITRIEVTAFLEPHEYLPSENWYRQYRGRELDRGLQVNRDIQPIAGATLSASAANRAARRMLALDGLLRESEGEKR